MFWIVAACLSLLMLVVCCSVVMFLVRQLHWSRVGEANATARNKALGIRAEHLEEVADRFEKERDRAKAKSATWQRKFWDIHGVVESVLLQRDEWREMFRTHVGEHLEGQALLENKIVVMRQHVLRAVGMANRIIKEHGVSGAAPIANPKDMDPLDGPPVGQAKRYYERMRDLLTNEAPAKFDALLKRSEIVKSLPLDDDADSSPEMEVHVDAYEQMHGDIDRIVANVDSE